MPTYSSDTNLESEFLSGTRIWSGGYQRPAAATPFSDTTLYASGDTVIFNGNTYSAPTTIPAGDFDSTQWTFLGSDFVNTEEINLSGNSTLTAKDCTVVIRRLGSHSGSAAVAAQGTLDFDTVIVDLNDIGTGTNGTNIGGSNNISYDWKDVTVLFTNEGNYKYFGSDHNRNSGQPVVNWENVRIWGDTENNQAALAAVFTNINTTSVISGVSLTNGEPSNSVDLKGGILQADGRLSWPNVTLGPLTTLFNGVASAALFLRFAAGNVQSSTHIGIAGNLDFRALSQLAGSPTQNYIMDLDAGAHVAFVNWLPGIPQTFNSAGFVSNFVNAGRAHVFVGTNPDLGTGEHLISFDRATVDPNVQIVQGEAGAGTGTVNIGESSAGVFLPETEAWNRTRTTSTTYNTNTQFNWFQNTPGTSDGLVVNGTDVANGIMFQNQSYSPQNSLFQPSYAGSVRNIDDLTTKQYRKYSWTQQPLSVSDTEGFGKLITVAVPPTGATDAQVAIARTGGYDSYDGTAWGTSTDVSDTIDAILSQTALNTVAKTTALVDVVGGATIGSHLVAGAKLGTWRGTNAAGVTSANTRRLLNYNISGTAVTFAGTLELSATAPNVSKTGINYILPMGDIAADEFITDVTATSTLTINGNSLNTTTTKVAIGSSTLTVLDGNVRNIRVNGPCRFDTSTARTYTDLTINGDIQSLRNVHTITGLSVIGSRTVAISGFTGTVSVNDVLGTGWSTTGTITLTSATAVRIQVDADDLTPLGVNLTQGNTVVIGNITYDYPAAPAVDRTINFAEVNTGDRYVIVQSGTTGSTTVASGLATGTTTPADWAFTRGNDTNTTFHVYYKKFGDVNGGTPTQYYVTRRTWNPMTDDTDLLVEPTAVPNALSQDGIINATAFFTPSFTGGNATFTLDRTATGFTTDLTLGEDTAVSLALAMMNTNEYFRAVWENRITETDTSRLINIGRGNATAYNQQGTHIRFFATDATALPNISGLSIATGTVNNIGAAGSNVPSVSSSTAVIVVGTQNQIGIGTDSITNDLATLNSNLKRLRTATSGTFNPQAYIAATVIEDLPSES